MQRVENADACAEGEECKREHPLQMKSNRARGPMAAVP
eukprot:CAMPEP_0119377362 /NCGR_PEP_ID=MMETSP1334-20130426/44460_1 /TAXON_ID=127549 /ORGANISM="Calcidiscus leptoporus, Strain RCC1130" /LENGTH=37 /DNA_ID= /DNA_START= /DNA_END= /DNA_ORIENTATION=